jgi:pimeloyl-ACP methyl ester carboxylesterase
MGMSTGGSLALQIAAEHPDAVRRLALISSGSRLAGYALESQRAMIRVAATGRARRTMAAFAWDIVPRWRGRVPAAIAMYLSGPRLYPHARDLRDLHATLVAEETFDLRTLPTITAPTLIINGGRDRFYERHIVDETANLIPGSRLVVFAERGHVTTVSDRRTINATKAFLSVRDLDESPRS